MTPCESEEVMDRARLARNLRAEAEQELRESRARMEMGDDYASLRRVLGEACDQASKGKGKERHAQDLPFDQHPMQSLIDLYGPGFAAGQIGKKAQEALRLPTDMAVQELLGVIVYAAGLVVWMRDRP